MKIVAISGKYLRFHPRVEVFPRHVAGEVVERLDGDLQTAGAFLEAFGDVGHHPDRDAGGQQQVQDPLVERDRAELEPGVELELVDRGEDVAGDLGSLVRGDAEQDREQHDPAHPHADDGVADLARLAHALFLGGRRPRSGRARGDRWGSGDGAHQAGPPSRPLPIAHREGDRVGDEDHQRRREAVVVAAGGARHDDPAGEQPDAGERVDEVQPEPRARLGGPDDRAAVDHGGHPLQQPRARPDEHTEGGGAERSARTTAGSRTTRSRLAQDPPPQPVCGHASVIVLGYGELAWSGHPTDARVETLP